MARAPESSHLRNKLDISIAETLNLFFIEAPPSTAKPRDTLTRSFECFLRGQSYVRLREKLFQVVGQRENRLNMNFRDMIRLRNLVLKKDAT